MDLHPDAKAGSIEFNGAPVEYADTGAPGDERITIVLVHGTGGTTATHFGTLYPMLAARHRVIGIDLRVDGSTTLDTLVAQVAALIEDRSAWRPIHLVGYSLGAVVTAALAGRHQHLVATLTLIAGWVATDKQQRLRHNVWRHHHEVGGRSLQEFQTLMAHSSQFLRSKSDHDLEAMIASRTVRPGTDIEMDINGTVDVADEVAAITAPTLVIGCLDDQMVPIRHSHMLFGGIQDSRLAEIPSGHAVTVERPAQLFQLIDAFVRQPDRHAAGSTIPALTI